MKVEEKMSRFGLNELTEDNVRKVSEHVANNLIEAALYFKEHYMMESKKNYEVFEIDGEAGDYIMFGNIENDLLLYKNLELQLESEGYSG